MIFLSVLLSVHICEWYHLNLVCWSLVAKTLRVLEQVPKRLLARKGKLLRLKVF